MDMNSKIPKWMPLEPAVCFPNQSEETSQKKTEEEEEEEMGRCKRPRRTLDSEGGVEEFLGFLDRIEESRKLTKRQSVNFSGSGVNAVEGDQMLMAMVMPGMQQVQGSSDAVATIAYNKSNTSPWKPSFQWEDFNKTNSDLCGAAATEKNKDAEESVEKGNGLFKTRSFLDRVVPAECSHDHVDDVNKEEEEDVEARPDQLELELFPYF